MNLHLALLLAILGTLAAVWCLSWQCCLHVTESRATRLADPDPMPGKLPVLPRPGRLRFEGAADPGFELAASYGPFPADTGPLLIWSEKTAALDAHEWEVREMIAEANRRIGPVQ